jgi:hypothetical protein
MRIRFRKENGRVTGLIALYSDGHRSEHAWEGE